MNRKLFSFMMVVCLVLTTSSPAMASCAHEGAVFTAEQTWQHEFYDFTLEGHEYRVYLYRYCPDCGIHLELTTISAYSTEYPDSLKPRVYPHEFTVLDHTGAHLHSGLHEYYYRCDEEGCSFSTMKLVPCSGPPCMIPLLKVLPEDQ